LMLIATLSSSASKQHQAARVQDEIVVRTTVASNSQPTPSAAHLGCGLTRSSRCLTLTWSSAALTFEH
jgi:hypothetical protein